MKHPTSFASVDKIAKLTKPKRHGITPDIVDESHFEEKAKAEEEKSTKAEEKESKVTISPDLGKDAAVATGDVSGAISEALAKVVIAGEIDEADSEASVVYGSTGVEEDSSDEGEEKDDADEEDEKRLFLSWRRCNFPRRRAYSSASSARSDASGRP